MVVNKKMIAGIAVVLALVCGGGGYVAMQNEKKVRQENVQISEMLDKLPDITVKEGESLPELKENLSNPNLIKDGSVNVDIQNVDVTVPGTYDIKYEFQDIHGQNRSKTVTCTVQANLIDHVYGMCDIQSDCGEPLPAAEISYDEFVDSVVRDDSMVDIDTPGTYDITYTILGTNGEMEEAKYLATILEVVKEEPKKEVEEEPEEPESEDAQENVPTEPEESGNVEVTQQEHTVQTADNNHPFTWLTIFLAGLAAAVGTFAVKFRKEKH